jgi:endonuclease-3
MDEAGRRRLFLLVFRKAERKYGKEVKRLSAEGWHEPWQTLISTMLSAQSRDEVTIPVAERLFRNYPTLEKLSRASQSDVLKAIRSINFNKTKAKNIAITSKLLMKNRGVVPDDIDELLKLPGVGRKTANLFLSEVHGRDTITVDTHVHRILNVLGVVRTRTPHQTETEMMIIAPRSCWSRINRLFVLWGKECPGRDRKKLLEKLDG